MITHVTPDPVETAPDLQSALNSKDDALMEFFYWNASRSAVLTSVDPFSKAGMESGVSLRATHERCTKCATKEPAYVLVPLGHFPLLTILFLQLHC
jgi:hypothetical protein